MAKNPKTVYEYYTGDPEQDAKTLAEYARIGIATEGSLPSSLNILTDVKENPEGYTDENGDNYPDSSYPL